MTDHSMSAGNDYLTQAVRRMFCLRGYTSIDIAVSADLCLPSNQFTLLHTATAGPSSTSYDANVLALHRSRRQGKMLNNLHCSHLGQSCHEEVVIAIAFLPEQNVPISAMRELWNLLSLFMVDRVLIFAYQKFTSQSLTFAMDNRIATCETFKLPLLSVMDHVLVPKHERLTPYQESLLLQDETSVTNLATLLKSDPVTIYLAFPISSIIRQVFSCDVGGSRVFYRVVRSKPPDNI